MIIPMIMFATFIILAVLTAGFCGLVHMVYNKSKRPGKLLTALYSYWF